jgi:AAA family ATP:ADP antiporter
MTPTDDRQRTASIALAAARRLTDVRREELGSLLLAAAYNFCVLSAWYVLRPIRDAMGTSGGVEDLPWLFLGTLAATLAAQPLFARLVARHPRRRFLPWTYRFFGLCLVAFFLAIRAGAAVDQVLLGRVFFLWANVFTLFVVSVFWAYMADVFRTDQGKRLFGFIAAGGTLGAVAGSAATTTLAERIGEAPLLVVSAALLEVAVLCIRGLGRRAAAAPAQARAEAETIGGGSLDGLARVLRSPYLLGICGFFLLYTIGSTFLYFLQAEVATAGFPERAARAAFFARIDLWVNGATLALQVVATGKALVHWGVGWTLALLPALSTVGFVALGLAPTVPMLTLFLVARRAANFALARPARENLFIPLSRADKYKAKTFIDTFVYRLGDQAGAWTHSGLSALGLGIAGLAASAVPLAALWLLLALWLGRRHARLVAGANGAPLAAVADARA